MKSVDYRHTLQLFYFSSSSDMKGSRLDQKIGRGFNTVTIVTNLNVFLYSACRFIVAGALPVRFTSFYKNCIYHNWVQCMDFEGNEISPYFQLVAKKFGGGPVMIGHLQTTFALSELVGKLFYGRLGDVFGERIAFILAFGAAVLSSAMLGITSSIQLLFLSRFLSES